MVGNYYLCKYMIHKFVLIIMQMKDKPSLTVWSIWWHLSSITKLIPGLKFPGIRQSAKAWFSLCDEKPQGTNRVFLGVDDDAGAQFVFTSVL